MEELIICIINNQVTNDLLGIIAETGRKRYIAKWANQSVGAIDDLENNNVLRFIDYYYKYGVGEEGFVLEKIHHTIDEELMCPIVAEGFIVFWIKNRKQKGTKQIFDEYYSLSQQRYEKDNEKAPDVWNRKLQLEFCERHPNCEQKRIKLSERLFPYLRQEDSATLKIISENYLEYAQSRKNDSLEEGKPRDKPGRKKRSFKDFVIGQTNKDDVINLIKNEIVKDNPKQVALVIIGGIEAGIINRDVSAKSIEREFGVKGSSVKPHLAKYKKTRETPDIKNTYFSETELKPYKDLYLKLQK